MTNQNEAVYIGDLGAKHYKNYTPLFNFGRNVIIGKYGSLAQDYLRETAPYAYESYSKYDEFKYILAKINDEAGNMMATLRTQLKKEYPTPKTDDFMKLAEHNVWIENMAEEIVLNDIVYQPHISDYEVIKAQKARHGESHS